MKKMNKWFYAFLAAAVLFVGAAVAALIIALSGNSEAPEVQLPPEGAETGVYYYDAERGEYNLSFNSGNKFTITGPDLNKSGTYAVNGSEITLDFVKDEDGTAKVTIANNVLTMLWKDTEMRFLKKETYTVVFQTNGGSEVASATILNGKTAAKPADPTKDGSAFIGWYADEACTKAFDFDTTVISANTTVYARWIVLEAGKSEYKVVFDLGYESEALASVNTVNSAVQLLPDPKREGYTFAGWWVSAYEDGEKLTYAYTEGTELTADTTLYALWIDDASQKLPAPAVSVTGSSIKWNAVNGATAYDLLITNAAGEEILRKTTGATSENFDFAAQVAGDYTVTVVAKTNDATKNSEPAVRSYRNKALDRVSGYSVIDGMLVTWNPVAGAQKYLVTVDCGDDTHNHTALDNGRNTFFNIVNCPMQKGGVKITVTAVANGYVDSVPTTYTYEKNLAAIDAIIYNEDTYSFEWARVENAVKYFVLVTCNGHTHALVDNGASTSYCVKYCTGEISIKVYPATTGYNSPEATEATYNKTTLPAPSNVALAGTTLTWDAVEGATSYQVKIAGKTFDVTTNSYNLNDAGITFVGGESYEVTVMAVGTKNSAYSDALSVKAVSLTNLAYYNNTVTWDPVIGVTGYEVSVNGALAVSVTDGTSLKVVLTKAGVNTISARTIGSSTWITIDVYAYEVVYDSRSLAGIAKEYLAVGDTMSMPTNFELDGYDFDGWYNAPGGATGNGIPYPYSVYSETSDTVLYANWTPKQYNIVFYGCENIPNINTGDTFTVTYTKDFKLPVPEGDDTADFYGWVTMTGEPVTDAQGNSLKPYSVTRDTSICPYFDTGVVEYTLRPDGTYAASKGPAIDTVDTVTIRDTYKGIAVTAILENGFYSCANMKYINIPDTVQLIGTGAFMYCGSLESVNVYEVQTQTPHEVVYSSDDGALLFYDEASNATYLEFFPRGKTGHYEMSDKVDIIRNLAFERASIESVKISENVSLIVKNAFYDCKQLKSVEFATGGSIPLTMEAGAFSQCKAIQTLVLPARLEAFANMRDLDAFTNLKTIDIEKGNKYYSVQAGMLCDALGQTILYCPTGYAGANGDGIFSFSTAVRNIAEGVFEGNKNIKEVVIPASLDAIATKAFYRCTGLEKVTVEGGRVKPLTIGTQAFAECTGLGEVNFGSETSTAKAVEAGAITIGAQAFASTEDNVGKLKTVNVYAGINIASIGAQAFENNSDLTKFNVADVAAITEIGTRAFANTGFQNFTLHSSTQTVGNQAFADCYYLNSFTFSSNEKLQFGTYAFQNSVALAEVILPAAVKTFDPSALDGCTGIKRIVVEPGSTSFVSDDLGVLYTAGYQEIIFYPSTLTNTDLTKLPWDKITSIGANVFKGNKTLTSITIGANVTAIGNSAFENCVNITEIKFAGESYANLVIGANAFKGCNNKELTTVDLSKGVKSIGIGAFMNCTKLTTVTLPTTLTVIPESLFEGCSALANVNVGDLTALTTIGPKSFKATVIKSITIPNTVTKIGDGAFYSTKQLATLIFAPGGTADLEIGTATTTSSNAVFGGAIFTSVDLPDRLSLIGRYTFYSCQKLVTVNNLPNTKVTELHNSAFQTCKALTTIDLTGITTIGGSVFSGCTALTSIVIPEGVTTIGNGAFSSSGLASVTLPNTLTTIGNQTFQNSKLVSVVIPNSVTSIGTSAFTVSTLASVEFATGGTQDLTIMNSAFQSTKFTSITLPARLTNFGGTSGTTNAYSVFGSNNSLVEIKVEKPAEGSVAMYSAYDGMLYRNEDPETGAYLLYGTLLYCPVAKTGTGLVAKETVFVQTLAFNATKLTTLVFEEFEENDPRYGVPTLVVGRSTNATSSLSPVFKSTTLTTVKFPSHLKRLNNHAMDKQIRSSGADLTVEFNPKSLVEFGPYVFAGNTVIKTMDLPMIASMERNAFQGATNITRVTVADTGSTVKEYKEQAFRGCSKLEYVEIANSVETLEKIAFEQCQKLSEIKWEGGCPNLKSISDNVFVGAAFTTFEIPDSVEWVGEYVWQNCQNLTKIIISDSMVSGHSSKLTGLFTGIPKLAEFEVSKDHKFLKAIDGVLFSVDGSTLFCYPQGKVPTDGTYKVPNDVLVIDYYAFNGFKGSQIILPESLEEIMNGAFSGLQSLTSITIPRRVHTIHENAFSGCYGLTKVEFAAGSALTKLGNNVFSNCRTLNSINLPDNVSEIGYGLFQGCFKLETLILPKALTSLPTMTFAECTGLRNLTIQEGLNEIGSNCFLRCYIEVVNLPDSLVTIDKLAFTECPRLTTVNLSENGNLKTIGDQAFNQNASLTKIGFGSKLESIGAQAFINCTALKSIAIPNSVTSIGKEAFKGCTALETATMSSALEAVPENLFENCGKLGAIYIGPAVKTIGKAAFKNCVSLATVTVDPACAITEISEEVFAGTTALTEVAIPSTVKSIGNKAFYQSGISTLNLPSGLVTLGEEAFRGCVNLESVSIPNGLAIIPAYAFAECTSLETVGLYAGLERINDYAFSGCSSLKAVAVPSTVERLGQNPFMNCGALESFELMGDASFTLHEGVLYDKNLRTLLFYPASKMDEVFTVLPDTKVIAGGAFSSSKLKKIVLHEDITTIPDSAFENSALLEEVVMQNVTSIGNSAFKGCASLAAFTVPAAVTHLGDYVFAGCTALTNAGFVIAERKEALDYGTHLFEGCTSITALINSSYLNTLKDYMYANTGIVELVLGSQDISAVGVFANCKKLTSVSWNASVSSYDIGDAFFYGCTALEEVVLPEGLVAIGDTTMGIEDIERRGDTLYGVFAGCTALETVTLSRSIQWIGVSAFENCTSLTTVNCTIEDRGPNIGVRAFKNCTSFADVTFVSQMTNFGDEAFMNCVSLKGEVDLSKSRKGVEILGKNAFFGCKQITVLRIGFIAQCFTDSFAGMGSDELGTGLTVYIHMDPKEYEGMFGKENPLDQIPNATREFAEPGEGKK